MTLYIGIMSGTSLDGLDICLVQLESGISLSGSLYLEYPAELKQDLLRLCQPGDNEILHLSLAEQQWARLAASGIQQLLAQHSLTSDHIKAIGSHGQTIRHHPELGFSMQIGAPALLAELTGISVITHFRQRDIAAGGQGAPLVPAFHHWLFQHRPGAQAIVNIGGFSNISFITPDQPVSGFDCGPGNVLLDAWINQHQQLPYDNNGNWAASGQVQQQLLDKMLMDDFFQEKGPKSTGRELFNLNWLQRQLQCFDSISAVDVQCTLAEFTACAISNSIRQHHSQIQELWLCGGGAHNAYLRQRLAAQLPGIKVGITDEIGVGADWMEAMAFAWLAHMFMEGKSASLPLVTGAKGARVLGALYPA